MSYRTRLAAARAFATSFADPGDVSLVADDDGPLLRDSDVYDDLDAHNRCTNPGGCIYLTTRGRTACMYCDEVVA